MTDVSGRVVDADGHVLEPADTWVKYLDPSYRDRAIRIARDDEGYEVLVIDGRPLKTLRGQLGALGGIAMDPRELLTRGQVSYAEGSPPGGYDPLARLRVMDGEGIDAVLLYPTIGICWEGHVTDGNLATAYTRAYNRWLAEFCRTEPRRLYPVAHISLLDPAGAVAETVRARQDGCVGIYLSPDLAARGGRHFDDPVFSRFWETAQDLEMPIAFHVVVRDQQWFRQWLRRDPRTGCSASRSWLSTSWRRSRRCCAPVCSSATRVSSVRSSRPARTGSSRGWTGSITSTA